MEYPKESAPVPEMPGFDSPLSMESSGALVIADLHTPYHSKEMLELAMLVSSDPKYGVSDVIIAGDLFDLSSASSHPANEYRSQISSDIESAGNVIKYISSFPHINRVTVLNGNHDERLAKRSGTNLSLRHLVNAAIGDKYVQADVVVTEYDYVEYNDSWLIGHLSTYSRRPGEVARRIAELYKKNVAVGHDHIQGYTSTLDGKYIAISMGAMFSNNSGSTPFWYKERRLTDMPRMSLGFLILSGSVPFLFNEYGMSSLNGGASWQDIGIDV
jgi:predicted phosphodiesterase